VISAPPLVFFCMTTHGGGGAAALEHIADEAHQVNILAACLDGEVKERLPVHDQCRERMAQIFKFRSRLRPSSLPPLPRYCDPGVSQ
jgi:hypothetical protein